MERHRWCLAALGLISSVFFLATQAPVAPLGTLIFCCLMLIASIWLKIAGAAAVLAAGFVADLFLGAGQFPWVLFMAQTSVAICAVLSDALLAAQKAPENIQEKLPEVIQKKPEEPILEIAQECPVQKVAEKIEENAESIATLPKQDESVNEVAHDMDRLHLLNHVRVALWEKEILIEHLESESKKRERQLEEKNELLEQLQQRIDHHPAQIAHRELRKQFAEKANALHQMRKQLFALEGEFLILQREQEEVEGEKTQLIADLMQALGEAEKEQDRQEEHIISLEQHLKLPPVKRASPKRIVRRKKVEDQVELFELSPATSTLPRNRKKHSTASSTYFGK